MQTKTINDEIYYKLDNGPLVKVHEGIGYKDGDTFYLKKDCKNEIVKEEYDHWRAMAKIFVFLRIFNPRRTPCRQHRHSHRFALLIRSQNTGYQDLRPSFFGISSVLLQYFFSISSVNHCRTTEELPLKYCRTDGECACYVRAAKVCHGRHNKRGFSQL